MDYQISLQITKLPNQVVLLTTRIVGVISTAAINIADRVVDELNPENQLSRKQVDVLLQYEDKDLPNFTAEQLTADSNDHVLASVLTRNNDWITKVTTAQTSAA